MCLFTALSSLDAYAQPDLPMSCFLTTLRSSPDALILHLLLGRSHATAAAIGATCRLSPGEVRSRLAHLESLRHVTSRQDNRMTPPARVYAITAEGRRKVEP